MVSNEQSKQLQAFLQLIKNDWKGRYRKYPDQTAFALQDHRVLEAIEKRFSEGNGIKAVRLLDYDFYTGLHNLVFDFEPPAANLARECLSLLTILDAKGKVLGIIDPFDPVQPNKFVPPLPQEGDLPFVLDRPSPGQQVSFSDQDVYPLQVRSHSFFQQLQRGGSSLIPIDINTYTLCSFQTTTPWGSGPDYILDDCGQPWLHE